jgi:hypothetical protein
MGVDPTRGEAVRWWWSGPDGVRVVVVAFGCLVASGPLEYEQLASIDDAFRRGSVLDADFGADASLIDLTSVVAVRYVPKLDRTVLVSAGGSVCRIDPVSHGEDVARQIFDHIAAMIAPTAEPREGFVKAPRTSSRRHDGRVPAAMGLAAVGVLALSAWADPDRTSSGPAQVINDFFVSIGWFPLLLVLVGLLVSESWGMISARAATSRRLSALQVDVYGRGARRPPPASAARSDRGRSRAPSRLAAAGRGEAVGLG